MAEVRSRLHPVHLGVIQLFSTLVSAGAIVAGGMLAFVLIWSGFHPRFSFLPTAVQVQLYYLLVALGPATLIGAANAWVMARRRVQRPFPFRPVLGWTAAGGGAALGVHVLLLIAFPEEGAFALVGGYELWLVAIPALLLGTGARLGVARSAREPGILAGR